MSDDLEMTDASDVATYTRSFLGMMEQVNSGEWCKAEEANKVFCYLKLNHEQGIRGLNVLRKDVANMHRDEIQNMTDNHAEALEALAAKNEADMKGEKSSARRSARSVRKHYKKVISEMIIKNKERNDAEIEKQVREVKKQVLEVNLRLSNTAISRNDCHKTEITKLTELKGNEIRIIREELQSTATKLRNAKTQLKSANIKKTMAIRFAILVSVYAVVMNVLFVAGACHA